MKNNWPYFGLVIALLFASGDPKAEDIVIYDSGLIYENYWGDFDRVIKPYKRSYRSSDDNRKKNRLRENKRYRVREYDNYDEADQYAEDLMNDYFR
ncbi:hypothetical protein AU255_11675 [Methyloprofundus sedimenti]|uniref:Uncharacterized protein n=1 Tax=Methyloprofundus sedimenti TaxID=1420851 RepID=A0A1V8MAB4_9GAMM|nr:hypothetical protein [Methyloprofundus sedimenti]OQK18442.1 hypothetical protein AU255_11675 [Methyloprofundus sedimenti]